jgi:hypothetical protein
MLIIQRRDDKQRRKSIKAIWEFLSKEYRQCQESTEHAAGKHSWKSKSPNRDPREAAVGLQEMLEVTPNMRAYMNRRSPLFRQLGRPLVQLPI